jgi:hypothetical protein
MNLLSLRNLPLKPLAFFVAIAALLAISVMWVWSATHPARINVSRQEYQAALARWRTLGVEEYEITIHADAFIDGGDRTIHVSNGGATLVSIDPPSYNLTDPRAIAYLRSDTVEGMFEDIQAVLGDQIQFDPTYYSRVSPSMVFTVKFHPQMGYPTEFSGGCRATWPWQGCPTDIDWRRVVTSLSILKQISPVPAR